MHITLIIIIITIIIISVTYFDSFGVEHIPKEIKAFIDCSFPIVANIYRIQAYDLIKWDIFVLDLLILCLQERP